MGPIFCARSVIIICIKRTGDCNYEAPYMNINKCQEAFVASEQSAVLGEK